MKKLTLVNPSQQNFWKMPESFVKMIHEHFSDWEIRTLENFEKDLPLLKDADAIIGLPFPASLIRANKNLKWVHFLTNQVPLSWQKLSQKYQITNSKVSGRSVAEHALHLILKGLRQEVFYHDKLWTSENYGVAKLASESSLGIIGFGAIGEMISSLTLPLFSEVRFLTSRDHSPAGTKHYAYDNDQDFFKNLDVLVICTEHNPRTQSFFHDPSFYQKLKRDIIMINVSRGELLVESELVNFLKNHPEACYLSDVATPEPYPLSGELLKLSNVYLTPHIGARFETIWNKLEAECLEVIKDKNV